MRGWAWPERYQTVNLKPLPAVPEPSAYGIWSFGRRSGPHSSASRQVGPCHAPGGDDLGSRQGLKAAHPRAKCFGPERKRSSHASIPVPCRHPRTPPFARGYQGRYNGDSRLAPDLGLGFRYGRSSEKTLEVSLRYVSSSPLFPSLTARSFAAPGGEQPVVNLYA
jgi:hypothetical protein